MSISLEIEEALLETVIGLENPGEQREFLELVRRGDPEQSKKLADMLAVQAQAVSFFREAEGVRTLIAAEAGAELMEASPSWSTESSEVEAPGERIGHYRLIQRIGEGSCGVVYLAEQLEPVHRHVALKIIRLGMDTERLIARFEMERQALAMMDHPNISRVFDAGATETGRPYFVMEWVRGLRITDYCDENRLDLNQRIDLFIEVCKGIQHAHQKGVIHRDIKPSNILISEENGKPIPKVIDFGVAKAIEAIGETDTVLTVQDQVLGTPAYMSPEQADQKCYDIDTRSDVYSLGMLLYEMLAGRTPFDSKELLAAGTIEMRRILAECEPPQPSANLAGTPSDVLSKIATVRNIEDSKLISAVKGDLDSVIMKAIEKDRQSRYDTVNGLVMDLQRFMDHEPVIARPRSKAYLFRKFVRRNRMAVGSTVAVLISLILGMGAASAFYLRERNAKQEQVRLRELAEAAHASERQRLAEAQEWENFAKVSMLLSEGKSELADEQLRQTPLSSIKLSPQMAELVRMLGNWNALRGRWQQASECFVMLMKADDLNPAGALARSMDMPAIGPTLIEGGNAGDYARFREWALKLFQNNKSYQQAHRLLHTVLLAPVDDNYLQSLAPAKQILEASEFDPEILKISRDKEYAIWSAFGLALLEYRKGNFMQCRMWADRAKAIGANRDYIQAAIESVHAMADFRLGNTASAKAELKQVGKRLGKAFSPELPAAFEPLGQYQGYWWDWIIARILFREAEILMKNTPPVRR